MGNETGLTDEQVEQYWRDGYLFPLPAISAKAAAAARAELEALERTGLEMDLPRPLNTYKRTQAHLVFPFAAELARSPAVLATVARLIGPDVMIFSAEFFIKEPRTKAIVSMHQDLTYWGLGAIDGLVTAWIALSPATPASGCMDFVQGSHKNPILPHEDTFAAENLLSRGQEVRVDVAPEDRVAIELQPGQMSLHHGLTIHGSGPNVSDDRRIGFVVRYLRPEVVPESAGPHYAMLALGADRTGRWSHLAPPLAPLSAEGLALHEEVREAQAQVMMRGARQEVEMYR